MAYHFHDLSPYVLIGNPLTLSVIEFFAVPGALVGAALYPLGLDAPVWLYVGTGIKFILMCARFIAEAPGSTLHLRAFAPYALPFLALGVMSATIWRTWTFRSSAIPFAIVGLIGATQGVRYDVIVAPSGDLAAVRDADGRLQIAGKRVNAFAAEQWLAADGDGRDPAAARDADAPCDRLGCVAALPEGESLSIVLDPLAFDEDCERAEVIVSALTAPAACKAKFVLDEKTLARTGAVGLTWSDEAGFAMASDRSSLQDRPWSPGAARGARRPAAAPRPCDLARRRSSRCRSGAEGGAVAEATARAFPAPINESRPKEPSIKGDSCLRSYRNPRRVGVVRIDNDVRIAPGSDDGRNNEQSGPSVLNPVPAEGLGDRHIAQVVPTGVGGGNEHLARNVVGDDGFDKSRGAWRRLAIGMHEKLDQTDGEARSGVNHRKARRIPALAKQAGALPGPDGVGAGSDAPEPKGQGLERQAEFERV